MPDSRIRPYSLTARRGQNRVLRLVRIIAVISVPRTTRRCGNAYNQAQTHHRGCHRSDGSRRRDRRSSASIPKSCDGSHCRQHRRGHRLARNLSGYCGQTTTDPMRPGCGRIRSWLRIRRCGSHLQDDSRRSRWLSRQKPGFRDRNRTRCCRARRATGNQ